MGIIVFILAYTEPACDFLPYGYKESDNGEYYQLGKLCQKCP